MKDYDEANASPVLRIHESPGLESYVIGELAMHIRVMNAVEDDGPADMFSVYQAQADGYLCALRHVLNGEDAVRIIAKANEKAST